MRKYSWTRWQIILPRGTSSLTPGVVRLHGQKGEIRYLLARHPRNGFPLGTEAKKSGVSMNLYIVRHAIPKAGINCGFKKRRAKDLVRSGYDETI